MTTPYGYAAPYSYAVTRKEMFAIVRGKSASLLHTIEAGAPVLVFEEKPGFYVLRLARDKSIRITAFSLDEIRFLSPLEILAGDFDV